MIANLIVTSLIMLLFVLLIWAWYLKSRSPSIIDVCWSIGIFLCASSFLIQNKFASLTLKSSLAWFLLFIWSSRLAGFLWLTRVAKKNIDPRYEAISNSWKISKPLGFLLNYSLQALLMIIIALPFLVMANYPSKTFLISDYFATILVCIGIIGESIADAQLLLFKRKSKGMVCEMGLWNYSRHPNYFFDWITWLGFCLFGISSEYGYISLISPILLLSIFIFVTGPITERQSLISRGEAFIRYQKSTSFFIPWFKK